MSIARDSKSAVACTNGEIIEKLAAASHFAVNQIMWIADRKDLTALDWLCPNLSSSSNGAEAS